MYQFIKSAFAVASLVSASVFQPAVAAVTSVQPLPLVKTIHFEPETFAVAILQNSAKETVRFSIQNYSGERLRCSLRGPDGALLETFFIKASDKTFNRDYLFSSADEGVYQLEVARGKERVTRKITVQRVYSAVTTKFTVQ